MTEGPNSNGNAFVLDSHQKEVLRLRLKLESEPLLGIRYRMAQTQEEMDLRVGKWNDLTKPPESLDCSGLTEGVCRKVGLRFPHGAQAQYDFTLPTIDPKPGDFGFFGHDKDVHNVYHVGMIFDPSFMIEARGFQPESSFETGKVILRHRKYWDQYPNFIGYRSHPVLL